MTRLLILTLAMLGVAAPAASAAKLTYEPKSDQIGTYVLAADASGGDLILSAIVEEGTQAIQLQYKGSIDYSAVPQGYCGTREGDSRLYCAVAEGDGFRYEGTDAVDDFDVGSEGLYPWMPLTFNGRGGNDEATDEFDAHTAARVWDGGTGNDKLDSQDGADRLEGGDGNDELEAGAGSQELRGGAGNDVLRGDVFSHEWGGDVLDGGAGFDEGDYWSHDGDGDPPLDITQDGVANDGRPGENDNVASIEKIRISSHGNFSGTQGDDVFELYGSSGPKTATMLGGNDKFDGSDNQETVDGGPGNDELQGSFGHDTITGGPGQDIINGDGGSYCDLYSCSVPFGNDTIHARDGEADTIECGTGQDKVTADAVDTVAPSCETVDRPAGAGGGGSGPGGTGPGGTTPGGTSPGGTTTPAAVGLKLLSRKSLRALLASGLRFEVACPGACAVTGRLVHRRKAVGAGRKSLLSAGKAKVAVNVGRRHKAKLRRLRKASLTLKVSIEDAAGATSTVSKTFSFRR